MLWSNFKSFFNEAFDAAEEYLVCFDEYLELPENKILTVSDVYHDKLIGLISASLRFSFRSFVHIF